MYSSLLYCFKFRLAAILMFLNFPIPCLRSAVHLDVFALFPPLYVVIRWLSILYRIQEVPHSNLVPEILMIFLNPSRKILRLILR
jgi:hypothetical protein